MKIRTRLILAFLVLGLAAALSVGALAVYATRGLFGDYVGRQRAARLAQWRDILAGYYAGNGSWDGVDAILDTRAAGPGHMGGMSGAGGMNGMGRGAMWGARAWLGDRLVLTDPQGKVIAGILPTGQQVTPDALAGGLPIAVDGTTVGILVDLNAPTDLATADADFLAAARRAILLGALAVAVVAVAAGALLARHIAAPISALTAAVSRGASAPVPVKGSGEVRRLAEEFNRMLARLTRNEQVRRTMVSDIAHELRTPLAVLSAQLETLGGRCSGDAAQQVLLLQDEVLRLSRLVNDLQTLSLADAGALTINRRPTDLRELLSRVTELTVPVAADRGIAIELEAAALPPLSIDPDRITQAVLNLVSNALRHTPDGGRITISLAAGERGEGAVITVADSGPGIAADDLPFVFERFYRADPARARANDTAGAAGGTSTGSGLGLAIVRGIVEAHGGRAWVESAPGHGAQFHIALPGRLG